MNRNGWVALGLAVTLLGSGGCGPQWKRKFIRKKKDPKPPQAILVLQADHEMTHSARALYRERYAFWKSRHRDLTAGLGKSRKSDLANLKGAIGELTSMERFLLPSPKKERLGKILKRLNQIEADWAPKPAGWTPPSSHRIELEKFRREIAKDFAVSDVASFLPEEAPLVAPPADADTAAAPDAQ
ncbi:MAG: hypothetical protein COV76_07860 [Candidatus Omnitrophica bacterium CG11_big_fil_rev_8_21_14_0_20_64_10]|nr:MAG: hypothetical protein COV76_07860 [Candidatus Omnitrophica bacterium CG11_big_fil_rev_8_21_14_0_20_64_10]